MAIFYKRKTYVDTLIGCRCSLKKLFFLKYFIERGLWHDRLLDDNE